MLLSDSNPNIQLQLFPGDSGETLERAELTSIVGLTVLQAYIFRAIDKKLIRVLFDSHKKVGTTLSGRHLITFILCLFRCR